MSIDRATGLFTWTDADVSRFKRRVARLNEPARPELVPCLACAGGDHRHAIVRTGPFLICHCLKCETLVVEGEPYA